jgi:choline dehydrogenase-like flavoprotein
MINDLQLADAARLERETQVCIVGAGTAGLFLARLLRLQGIEVVLVEAGSSVPRSSTEMMQHCEQRGVVYRGVEDGRSFGLGGTSVLWGGQLISMTEADLDARPEVGFDAWPIRYSELAPYFSFVRQKLGLETERSAPELSEDELLDKEFSTLRRFGDHFQVRLSEWLPFKLRNFAHAFAESIEDDEGLIVWLNAAVVGMTPSPSGPELRIQSVTAQSPTGRTVVVRANVVVICAGALESTRLLLAFDEAAEGLISRDGAPLGCYFGDHLSLTCARFVCKDWRRYNLAVAPIFRRGIMRTPRLELTPETQRKWQVTSAFAHFTFVTGGDSAVMLARTVSDVAAMAYWRGIHRRLWIPRHAELLLQLDIEQAPNRDSRLFLAPERDALGRKRLIVDWRIGPSDVRTIRKVAEMTVVAWRKSPLNEVAEIQSSLPDEFDSLSTLYDVYHPAGSLRMGSSSSNSIVDRNLALWRFPNCFVSTTAVFPSTGSANPGMAHLALTARLAETITRRVRS